MATWHFDPWGLRSKRQQAGSAPTTSSRRQRTRQIEQFEQRMLLAISPTLVAIIPNDGAILTPGQTRDTAPRELTIRFDAGQTIDPTTVTGGIQIVRSGNDGTFGNANDVTITPGYIGIGDNPNEIIVRFAETLPDDFYQLTVVGQGANPIKNIQGDTFNSGTNVVTPFRLDLGSQILAVVPQPVTRTAQGTLQQANDQIVVYFNNDRLDLASAQNVNLYQLIFTANSASNADDVVYKPTTATYNQAANAVTLTFASNLSALGSGPGTYRLRVGDDSVQAAAPNTVNVVVDAGSSIGTANNLGVLTSQSQILSGGAISNGLSPTNTPYGLILPGGNDNPGHRDIPAESHLNGGADGDSGIATYYYNFRLDYGSDPQGNPLENVISEAQKQRAREVFEMYGYYLGVKFVESPNQGLTIATGDLRVLDPAIPTGPGGVAGLAGGGIAIMDAAEDWGNSEFGGGWFTTAMHEIGHLLGLGHTYEQPPLTVQGNNGGLAVAPPEAVFPGDIDITHGQHLYRPDSKDIDFYRFQLTTSGRFSAETVAERLPTSSLLDTVISLYNATGQLIARNDDYFSADSFLDLQLEPGVYYVGISSTGNIDYNPLIIDSGFGGTSEGAYTLRLNFDPTPAGTVLVDSTQTAFDGDYDGAPGGEFNFWFNVGSSTIYVDKVAAVAGANGTLARPYTTVAAALAVATPGSIVRIVGNGGADGDLNTLGDNRAYEIGLNQFNVPLSDGATMDVPKGVTVMIDAGAVFKLRQANINVGSFAQGIDMSRSALQVLGTPTQKVTFTSYHNEAIGVDTFQLFTTPAPGDWGGLVFRGGTPDLASDSEDAGIFVNYVGQANIGYGGGTVVVDSKPEVYGPIHMVTSRPTVAFNTITNSAVAAISADPDSFAETLFRDNSSTAEYSRVGPEIHGNRLLDNSLNALFVRIRTEAGVPVDVLHVQARFNDTDIVHVISENLLVQGTPGGPMDVGGGPAARLDARLAIDPGVVLKLKGSRIEVGMSAQLIAEGTAANRVIFTSLADDRYGAGGTFDTTGDAATSQAVAGDWGGVYFNPVAKGSFDHVLITFAGGSTPIEGAFARFNAIEIRQADVRIANSILEVNADGLSSGDRNGRGTNASATIFVRGAQPVLLNNIISSSSGDAININANALNTRALGDYGRSTGRIDVFGQFNDNQGPLVRLNRLVDNDVNGMAVRGGTLTTETVWDDTDIVHVVRNAIEVPNLHTYGGLRLQSSATQSLVIKLSGPQAGFTAGGSPLDIDDRIGGTLEVLGTPGHPVVLTSLSDQSVGAGFDLQGQPQTRTLGGNVPAASPVSQTNISFRFSPEFAANTAAVQALQLAASYWVNLLNDPVSLVFDIAFGALDSGTLGTASSVIEFKPYDEVRQRMIADSVAGEEIVSQLPTLAQLQTTLGSSITVATSIAMSRANALALGYTPAELSNTPSAHDGVTPIDATILFTELANWDFNRFDGLTGTDFISTAIHEIGHALGFGSAVDVIDGGGTSIALSTLDMFRVNPGAGAVDFTNAPRQLTPGAPAVFYDGGVFNRGDIVTGELTAGDIPLSTGETLGDGRQASHWKNRDLLGVTEAIGIMDPVVVFNGTITSADSRAMGLIGWDVVRRGSSGDWAGLTLAEYSNDRNVDVTTEFEPSYTGIADNNATPGTAQFLGTLAANQMNGDDNRRLGFEIHGAISFDRSADLDVYSFNGTAGTEIWIDIDRTSVSLDTVVELVDANGNVLARSNDSTAESANPGLFTNNPAGNIARTMQRGEFSTYDLYTLNPRDAGMRLVLPGTVGTANTYYVRVRSNGTNLNNLAGGQTSGNYRLQIRLQEIDEFPGSTVRFADIRYAVNGIQVLGLPYHSPQVGEVASGPFVSNTTLDQAQDIGNLLAADRNTISIASAILNPLDVDWFTFTIDYQDIQAIGGYSDSGKTWATIFDIDYADGLSRPDLVLSVFDALGQLVWVSRDSSIADDQPDPDPIAGSSGSDLSRGSFGKLDPFIGSIQMPEGTSKTYYVAVSSNAALPTQLTATFTGNDAQRLIRLEPVNSVKRIVEDHIGSIGYVDAGGTQIDPTTPAILPITNAQTLAGHVVPFTLADLALYVSYGASTGTSGHSLLSSVNPFTGQTLTSIGQLRVGNENGTGRFIQDIAMRSDGLLYGTQRLPGPGSLTDDTAGRLVIIDPTNAVSYIVGNDNIPAQPIDQETGLPDPDAADQVTSVQADAVAFRRFPVNTAWYPETSEHYDMYYAVTDAFTGLSHLFRGNPSTGEASFDGVFGPVAAFGQDDPGPEFNSMIYQNVPGDISRVTGMAFIERQGLDMFVPPPSQIFEGQIFTISDSSQTIVFEFDKAGNGAGGGRTPVNVAGAVSTNDVIIAIQTAINLAGLNIQFQPHPIFFSTVTLIGAFGANAGNTELGFSTLQGFGQTLYGVSSSGQFFTLNDGYEFGLSSAGRASQVFQLSPTSPFTGLAAAPQNLDLNGDGIGGDLRDTLFAICANGDIYAIDALTGTFRTDIFAGGVDHISTFLQGATGLAFSSLDFNLWHPTNQMGLNPGHGVTLASDNSRVPTSLPALEAGVSTVGATSFYFGFENQGGGYLTYAQQGPYGSRQENSQYGQLSGNRQQDLTLYASSNFSIAAGTPPVVAANEELRNNVLISNSYNFPGGAHGALVTNSFSLVGYDYTDKPTLYFNYYLQSADEAGASDLARVLISIDDGATWTLAATNKTVRSDDPNTLPKFTSASSDAAPKANQHVQQLFEATYDATTDTYDETWRQARIDIGKYAGNANIKLRFEFVAGATNNNHRGFAIDDIVVGFTSRGEMVTRPLVAPDDPLFVPDTTYFPVPTDPDNSKTQVLVGPYQLEIRRGNEYATAGSGTNSLIALDPNSIQDIRDRNVRGFTLLAPSGNAVIDGETFTLSDGVNRRTFEFNSFGGVQAGNIAINYTAGTTPVQMAKLIRDAINANNGTTFLVSASSRTTSDRTDLFGVVAVNEAGTPALGVLRFNSIGDRNLRRDAQGQIVLQGNSILGSLNYGIVVDAGTRDAAGAHPGAVRNLLSINTAQLSTGVVLANNLIAYSQVGGILFSGEATAPNVAPTVVPFGRIINNTIYGLGTGVGIQVTDNAAPTLLNNILANLQTGIAIDPSSSQRTVIGGSLYQLNSANVVGAAPGAESFAIALSPIEPLFVNAAAANFNLIAGTKAIDSSINSLGDRQSMITINSPVGIGQSPILAPLNDLTGKLRVDDPTALPPPGLGSNVFKDRGALDRSDFTGPVAALVNPQDNDNNGIDQDPTLNRVVPAGIVLRDFQIQLVDGTGTGIDPLTVSSAKFTLTRDGVPLVNGVDYIFGYDATNHIVRFTPVEGIWLSGFSYEITLDNSVATGIKDLGNNPLLPNELSGATRFAILLLPLDFGDAPDPSYATLLSNNGARHVIIPDFYLGSGVTEDTDGRPNANATGDLDDGVVFNTPLVPGTQSTITVTASAAGFLDAWIDLNGDGDWNDPGEKIFSSQALVAGPNVLNVTLPAATATTTFARFRYSSTGGLGPIGIATDGEVEDYQVTIPASVAYTVQLFNPLTGKEVFKDATGRYVVLANTEVEARVFVDDTRSTGAAGGVFAGFADLTASLPFVQWNAGSLSVDSEFATAVSGSVDAVLGIDEAGGIGDIPTTGADPKQHLFTVRGLILPTAVPGTTFSLALNPADQLPAHNTLVYGLNGGVSATYQTVELVVPLRAWQNPFQPLDVFPDGFISGLDALLIINEINKPGGGSTPLDPAPVPPNVPPPYLDVDGDGFVSATDAILVINELNNPTLPQPFAVFSQPVPSTPVPSAPVESAAVESEPAAASLPTDTERYIEQSNFVLADLGASTTAMAATSQIAMASAPLPFAPVPVAPTASPQLTDLAITVFDRLEESLGELDSGELATNLGGDAVDRLVHGVARTLPVAAVSRREERRAFWESDLASSRDSLLSGVAQLFAAHAEDDEVLELGAVAVAKARAELGGLAVKRQRGG